MPYEQYAWTCSMFKWLHSNTPFHTYWGLGETFLIVNILNPHFFFHFNNGVEASSMNMNFIFLYCKQRSGFLVFSGINFSGSVIRVSNPPVVFEQEFQEAMLRNSQYMASLIAKPVALTQSKNPSRELWLEHYQAIQQEIIHIIIQSIYIYIYTLREWKL